MRRLTALLEPIGNAWQWRRALNLGLVAALAWLGACAGPSHSTRSPHRPTVAIKPTVLTANDRERVHEYLPLVEEASARYRVDPTLVLGIIWVESKFNRHAKSSAGARGLMQLMPPTARGLAKEMKWRVISHYDPEFNIHAGTYLISQNLRRFGQTDLALAAYNAGPSAVKRWLQAGKSLPKGIRGYVDKVLQAQRYFVAQPPTKPAQVRAPPPIDPPLLAHPPQKVPARRRPVKKPATRTTPSTLPDVDDPPPTPVKSPARRPTPSPELRDTQRQAD